MKIKPGYKTSEFWFTLVSFIFSGLYLTGLISENSHKEELITTVSHAVESVILISGQLLIFYKYVKGRSEVKKIAETKGIELSESAISNPTRKKKNATKRTGTSSSRNNNSASKRVSKKSKKNSTK